MAAVQELLHTDRLSSKRASMRALLRSEHSEGADSRNPSQHDDIFSLYPLGAVGKIYGADIRKSIEWV